MPQHPQGSSITSKSWLATLFNPELIACITQAVELHMGSRRGHLGASAVLWMLVTPQFFSQKRGSASAQTPL